MKPLPLSWFQRCLVVVTNWNREILNPIGSSWFPDNLRRGFHFPAAPAKIPNNPNDRFYLPTVQCPLADFPAVALICKFVYSILPPYTGCAKNPNGLLVLWGGLSRWRRAVWLALLRHSSHNKHLSWNVYSSKAHTWDRRYSARIKTSNT